MSGPNAWARAAVLSLAVVGSAAGIVSAIAWRKSRLGACKETPNTGRDDWLSDKWLAQDLANADLLESTAVDSIAAISDALITERRRPDTLLNADPTIRFRIHGSLDYFLFFSRGALRADVADL